MTLLALIAPYAPVVVAPLGLSLAATSRLTRRLVYPAGALAAASFFFEQGWLAALLVLPWFAFTIEIARQGALRMLARGTKPVEEFALHAGLLYLAMGGFWLVLSRLGERPLGFRDEIILLTAIHFHYAGFAACLFTAMTGRMLGEQADSRLYRWAAWAVIGGTPLLAVGISVSRWIEIVSAFWLALGVVLVTGLALLNSLLGRTSMATSLCLSIAAASTVISMGLAAAYAVSEFQGALWLPIPRMAVLHGLANALGLSTAGLVGYLLTRPAERYPRSHIPFSTLRGGARIGPEFFREIGPARGLCDKFDAYSHVNPHPAVTHFYENTLDYEVEVIPHWEPLFRLPGMLFLWAAAKVGQLGLPSRTEAVESRIFWIAPEGRDNPRAWVRTNRRDGAVIYAAAYSSHVTAGERYMNIAFPLPGGNMTSILKLAPYNDGVLLSTTWESKPGGDQGVYAILPGLRLRLALDETIWVWPEAGALAARHDMWLWGMRYLRLEYRLFRRL
ncbi:MAG: YndJ family protein [Bryobacteraceae bacterium]